MNDIAAMVGNACCGIMKNLFPGYYKITNAEIEQMWNDAFIVFDANAILNLYRYLPDTAENFHQILDRLQDRLWMPYQAAFEFHKNRVNVIVKETQSYANAATDARSLLEKLDAPRNHPFIEQALLFEVNSSVHLLMKSLDKTAKAREKLINEDPDLDKITKIFSNRVGAEPDSEQLEAWHGDASKRIENKVPPGYADADKEAVDSFGDILIWFQVIAEACARGMPVILVTDDAKQDWWRIVNGKTIGPRPEMVKEFKDKVGQEIMIVRPHVFLQQASEHLGIVTPQNTFDEVRAVSKEQSQLAADQKRRRAEREELRLIARHASKHLGDVQKCLLLIDSMPRSVWEDLDTPLQLPVDFLNDLSRVLEACPSIAGIIADVGALPGRVWLSHRKSIDPELVHVLSRVRTLPRGAIECVSTLSINSRSHFDQEMQRRVPLSLRKYKDRIDDYYKDS